MSGIGGAIEVADLSFFATPGKIRGSLITVEKNHSSIKDTEETGIK